MIAITMRPLRRALRNQLVGLALVVPLVASTTPAFAAEAIVYKRPAPGPDPDCVFAPCDAVWIANADGSNRRAVTTEGNLKLDWGPGLSADGEQVAVGLSVLTRPDPPSLLIYTRDGSLRETYPYPAGGSIVSAPRFSPDGGTLIFRGSDETGTGIYSLERGSGTVRLLVRWPNYDQIGPTYSPDGNKIAFYSAVDPQGRFHSSWRSGPAPWQIYTANSDGSNPLRVTPTSFYDAYDPKFSPDGQRLVFWGSKTKGSDQGRGLWTIGVDGSGLLRLTSGANDERPDWSSDGSKIAFSRPGDGIYDINPDGTGLREIIDDPQAGYPSYRQPRANIDYAAALREYAPQIRYDAQENFYADSAAGITDTPLNYLRRFDGTVIAAASDPAYPQLSLSFLNSPHYANGDVVFAGESTSDFLDEVDDTWAVDAQLLHTDAAYGNQIYGRAVQGSDGNWWLQYWLWYYYNDQDVLGVGNHEGDWEMVQVRLDYNGAPDSAAFSQHDGGEVCSWDGVERAWVGTGSSARYAPVAYSAVASHASYFHAGTWPRTFPAPDDHAGGDGEIATPTTTPIADGTSWIAWPGVWGGTQGTGPDSPRGPRYNGTDGFSTGGKWSEPSSWAAGVGECQGDPSGAAQQSRVPAPELSVRREGDSAVIDYAFSEWPQDPAIRPRFIRLTIDSVGRSSSGIPFPPLSYTYRPTSGRGRERQPLSLGPGPYTVHASAFAKGGRRSDLVSEQLP